MARTTTTKPSGFTTIRRVGPTQQVREQLLAAIERGDYAAGVALPSERLLCESFGVSRVSVREAIAALEAMGLISVQHGRGAFVVGDARTSYAESFSRYLGEHREELLELLRVRQALDGLAAEGATRKTTPEMVAHLRSLNDAFAAAVERADGDWAELSRLDVAFHLGVAIAGGVQLLPRLLSELSDVLGDSRRMTMARRGQLSRSVTQHYAIVDAIAGGDPKAAHRAAERHLSGIIDWVSQVDAEQAAVST